MIWVKVSGIHLSLWITIWNRFYYTHEVLLSVNIPSILMSNFRNFVILMYKVTGKTNVSVKGGKSPCPRDVNYIFWT